MRHNKRKISSSCVSHCARGGWWAERAISARECWGAGLIVEEWGERGPCVRACVSGWVLGREISVPLMLGSISSFFPPLMHFLPLSLSPLRLSCISPVAILFIFSSSKYIWSNVFFLIFFSLFFVSFSCAFFPFAFLFSFLFFCVYICFLLIFFLFSSLPYFSRLSYCFLFLYEYLFFSLFIIFFLLFPSPPNACVASFQSLSLSLPHVFSFFTFLSLLTFFFTELPLLSFFSPSFWSFVSFIFLHSLVPLFWFLVFFFYLSCSEYI